MSATLSTNPEQRAAIEESGVVFVSAGAGTGKTTVLVERYVKAVVERGLSVDSMLVLTYTDRAAGELKERVRARLRELGERRLTREIDRGWISTIHGFCARLLRSYSFEAGLDPRFRVLDESQARVLRAEAFSAALAEFCADRRPDRLRLLATYGTRGLATMLTGVFERLRSAGRGLELAAQVNSAFPEHVVELREAVLALAEEHQVEGDDRQQLEQLLELLASSPSAELLLDLSHLELAGTDSSQSVAFDEAREAVERAALDEVAVRDRDLLQGLLHAFDMSYRTAKERESALDFEDLQLLARELLRGNEAVRSEVRFRFRSIMIDEFQDTNRLQCELIDLIAGGAGDGAPGGESLSTSDQPGDRDADPTDPSPDLFFVGDEFQSIYRFRHADVGVFRERRSRSGGVLALTRNYRSRPEVLSVVNHLFASEFGEEFEPLEAAQRFSDPLFGPAVELLVTDKLSYRERGLPWRTGEARHVARRVRELVDSGEHDPGDVVLLFAAGTHAELYEEALRAEGLPTFRATGRGYFGQQQVADLLAYLRLLQNRYDDKALVSVLASPLVGVSNDALVLLRRAAGRRPLFSGLEREAPVGLSPRDRRLFEAFRQRYERLVRLSAAPGLEGLCERIIAEHDYDLAALARWDGKRRYANLRKLARLARSYEELRGPDLEGFVRFVGDQEAAGTRELEAVAEEEGARAVRLLTIHAAKGLEFKVVVVCDAGRAVRYPAPDEILCLPDGRFGFRVVDPLTGKRHDALDYADVRRAEAASEDEEARRLYYVAMTRAIDRLILAGSVDPVRRESATTPIGWALGRLGADLGGEQADLEIAGTAVVVRVDRAGDADPVLLDPLTEQLELFSLPESAPVAVAFDLPVLKPVPDPPVHSVRRLSYSALALFERCSYRYYVERVVGLSPERGADREERDAGLLPTEIGDAVHALLEVGASAEDLETRLRARYPGATAGDVVRVTGLVDAWNRSALRQRLAALRDVRFELPFAFEHEGVLLHGRVDVLHRGERRSLVVDYKTNQLGSRAPEQVVEEEYRLQQLVYALAALKAGAEEVEVVYVFLERPEDVVSRLFGQEAGAELSLELSQAIATIQAGEFRPSPSEHACFECPALDRVCAGPRLGMGDEFGAHPTFPVPS